MDKPTGKAGDDSLRVDPPDDKDQADHERSPAEPDA